MPGMKPAERAKRHRDRKKEGEMERERYLKAVVAGLKHLSKEVNSLISSLALVKIEDENGSYGIDEDLFDGFDKKDGQLIIHTLKEMRAVISKLIPVEDDAEEELLKDFLGKDHPENERERLLAEKKIAKNPKDLDAWIDLGISKLRLDDFPGAIKDLECALNLAYKLKNEEVIPDIYFNLACAFSCSGNKSCTLENLQNAIHLDRSYIDKALTDPFLGSVHGSPEFKALTKKNRTEKIQGDLKNPSKTLKSGSESDKVQVPEESLDKTGKIAKQVQEEPRSVLNKVRTYGEYLDFIDKLTKQALEQEESLEDFIKKKLPAVNYPLGKSTKEYLEFINTLTTQARELEQSLEKEKPAKKAAKKVEKIPAINEEGILAALGSQPMDIGDIISKMGIKDMADARYLQILLRTLETSDKLNVVIRQGKKLYRKK